MKRGEQITDAEWEIGVLIAVRDEGLMREGLHHSGARRLLKMGKVKNSMGNDSQKSK